jgi:hypothetical protein
VESPLLDLSFGEILLRLFGLLLLEPPPAPLALLLMLFESLLEEEEEEEEEPALAAIDSNRFLLAESDPLRVSLMASSTLIPTPEPSTFCV